MTDIDILFSSVPVTDFDAAVQWYGRLFGRECDVVGHESEVMWRIAAAAWLYLIADAERAGHAVVALKVADLSQTREELSARGIECGEIEIVGEGARKSNIKDADGNLISFIEVQS